MAMTRSGNSEAMDDDISTPQTLPPFTPPNLPAEDPNDHVWGTLNSISLVMPGVNFALTEEMHIFGRPSSSTANIPYAFGIPSGKLLEMWMMVSRRHFDIRYRNGVAAVKNMTKNGTFLDGKCISDSDWHHLADGAVVSPVEAVRMFEFHYKPHRPNNSEKFPPCVTKNFVVENLIGEGSFGMVYKAVKKVHKGRHVVQALKVLKMNGENATDLIRQAQAEINLLRSSDHVNIVKILGCEETTNCIYVFLEFMPGGELFDRLENPVRYGLDIELTLKIMFYQLANAILYLHEKSITHRDIKTENILCADDSPVTLFKIADFGMGRFAASSRMGTVCGTPGYMAPEMLKSKCPQYTSKVDIWSLGAVFYLVAFQHMAFDNMDEQGHGEKALERNIVSGQMAVCGAYRRSPWYKLKSLIIRMLKTNPEDRVNIYQVLNDEWLRDPAMDDDLSRLIWKGGPRPYIMPNFRLPKPRTYFDRDPWGFEREFPEPCRKSHDSDDDSAQRGRKKPRSEGRGEVDSIGNFA